MPAERAPTDTRSSGPTGPRSMDGRCRMRRWLSSGTAALMLLVVAITPAFAVDPDPTIPGVPATLTGTLEVRHGDDFERGRPARPRRLRPRSADRRGRSDEHGRAAGTGRLHDPGVGDRRGAGHQVRCRRPAQLLQRHERAVHSLDGGRRRVQQRELGGQLLRRGIARRRRPPAPGSTASWRSQQWAPSRALRRRPAHS